MIDINQIEAYLDKLSQSNINKREKGVWQRRYWEHTIRDEKDLYNHLDYVHFNPIKHNLVNNVKDWKFSSFHKFVDNGFYDINWGSLQDIRNIENLNYE